MKSDKTHTAILLICFVTAEVTGSSPAGDVLKVTLPQPSWQSAYIKQCVLKILDICQGVVAQWAEHVTCNYEVEGSQPSDSIYETVTATLSRQCVVRSNRIFPCQESCPTGRTIVFLKLSRYAKLNFYVIRRSGGTAYTEFSKNSEETLARSSRACGTDKTHTAIF